MSSTPGETLTFIRRQPLNDSIEALWFHPKPNFNHKPGQFVEIALPHDHPDSRGIRREFTIASSPTEPELMLAVKFTAPGSTFKQVFHTIQPGKQVEVTFLGGEFLLPTDQKVPILMVAGGIGITPFRAMLKWLVDRNDHRDTVLLWGAKSPDDFIFADVLAAAKKLGTRIIRLVSDETAAWSDERGHLDPAIIQRLVPDLTTRQIYLSGPEPLVEGLGKNLPTLGVPSENIHRDAFPGYRN